MGLLRALHRDSGIAPGSHGGTKPPLPPGDLYSAAAPSLGTVGGWGLRRELRKKEGAVVLDKETIDVSAFSDSLN